MKKIASFLILIIFVLAFSFGMLNFSVPNIANATGNTYIQIPDKTSIADLTNASVSTVPFISENLSEVLFYLPSTYFVKKLDFIPSTYFGGEDGAYYKVQYNGLIGIITISDLRTVYVTLPTPTANATVDTVGEAPAAFNSLNSPYMKYKAVNPTIVNSANVDKTWTISYMGETQDKAKYYVKCVKDGNNTVYGSIAKDNFEAFSIPLHQVVINAQAELKAKQSEADGEGKTVAPFGNDTVVKTVLIIGIIIPAVLIIILLFKPRKRGNNYDYQPRKMSEPSRYDYGSRDRRYDDDEFYQDDYRRYDKPQDRPRDEYYKPRDFRDEDR